MKSNAGDNYLDPTLSRVKARYDALREAGKPAKVAIVAVMRKLIELANALVKADRMWTEKVA